MQSVNLGLGRKKTSLKAIGGFLEGSMKRHGISKQVTAAIIVDRANDILDDMLGDSVMRSDVEAISVQSGVLVIGCKNAGASYDVDGMKDEIIDRLKSEVPEADIKNVVARVQIEKGRF